MVFKTLGRRQQRTVIPDSQEKNEVSPLIVPANFLKRVSRLWHRERKPRKSLVDFLRWQNGGENPGRPMQLEFTEQNIKQSVNMRKLFQVRKRTKNWENSSQSSHGARNSTCSHQPAWKLHNSQALGRALRRWGKIKSRLNAVLV